MTRFGVIGRADRGGLAAQTRGVAEHLPVDAAMIVDLGQSNRGPLDLGSWRRLVPEIRVVQNPPTDDDVRWLVDQVDVLYTAESTYHPGLNAYCHERGVRLVVHANAEIHDPVASGYEAELWAPTNYRLDLLPRWTQVVPMPVDLAAAPAEPPALGRPLRLLHVAAPAFNDRNGTALVLDALPFLDYDATLVIVGDDGQTYPERYGRVVIERQPTVDDRWSNYDNVDALVLPRRYGGLCLPMIEAASRGLPVVTLDLEPQCSWFTYPLVPAHELRRVVMKGEPDGHPIHDANPSDLAVAMNALADPETWQTWSSDAYAWATSLSWERQAPLWRRRLHLDESEERQ